MKRYWLMAISAVLLIILLISPCASLASSAEEATELLEAVTSQVDKQFFLLPKMNWDYSNKDTARQFENIIKDILLLLPENETVQVVLFPTSGDEVRILTETEELNKALKVPYVVKSTANWLKKIETDYAARARRNIVIAIESGDLTNSIEYSWEPLKQLANNGMEVYLIGLETKKNKEMGRALASWISNGQLDQSSSKNSIVTVADGLHFVWINDYSRVLEALTPLLKELTGLNFGAATDNEDSVSTFHPYAGLTEEIIVLLDNRIQDAHLNITDDTEKAVEYELVSSGNTLSVIRIKDDAETVKVIGGMENAGMVWAPVYGQMNGLKLEFGNSDNQTSFERNKKGSFYAAVTGLDQDCLARTMERHGASCKMMDAASGNVLQTMTYDATSKVFRADYVFSESSESKQIYAQILLNDSENTCLTSDPYTVAITNTAPEITAQSEPIYWIGNPWEEKKTSLTIPLTHSDQENDQVTLIVVQPSTPLMPGLGNVRLSDDQSELIIDLNEQPLTAEPFTIKVAANDGELTSEPYEISFILYDLTSELQQLPKASIVELPAKTAKYKDFSVSAKVLFPEKMPELLKKKLEEKIQEHYTCTLQLESPEGTLEFITMEQAVNWVCTGNIQKPGTYKVKALWTADKEALWIESEPKEIIIEGKTPVRTNVDFPAMMDKLMIRSEDVEEEFWQMKGLIPSRLFSDEDADEITISVLANRLNLEEGESPLTLDTQAVGDEEAFLRFTIPGLYEVSIVSSDVDGEGDIITCMVRVTSARTGIIQYTLFCVTVFLIVALLVWIIVMLVKPSFKGKIVEVTVRSTHWTKKTVVYADAWKKSGQPFSMLLTCAACPPDSMLYAALEECAIRPRRRGMVLLNGDKLGLEKKTRINANEIVTFHAAQYQVELKVTLD